jgi:hypothetical protein
LDAHSQDYIQRLCLIDGQDNILLQKPFEAAAIHFNGVGADRKVLDEIRPLGGGCSRAGESGVDIGCPDGG